MRPDQRSDVVKLTASQDIEVDVLIVGAGISGLGAAHYLQRDLPGKTFAIVEARGAIGGTWDLHRYPGIRSDSDLFTFGYEFKPWKGDAIASGDAIRDYLHDMADENGILDHVRFHSRVLSASWSSRDARWTVELEDVLTGSRRRLTCAWLFGATGYYRYEQGFTPQFAGRAEFEAAGGTVVHPQLWPEGLDYDGKKVVVVGSGATAVTLVPSLAKDAQHVTMLQRSPGYIISLPRRDPVADALRQVLPEERVHALVRKKNIFIQRATWWLCQRYPKQMRALLLRGVAKQLPPGYPIEEHFSPSYNPWDQRLCAVPDGDLFKAISRGDASVVTDTIESFTSTGILLSSGKHLDADIIVTATGLDVEWFGGITLEVDGEQVTFADRVAYKGMMLTGVPNYAYSIGYTNSSWTLKVGLLCEHFVRLLDHLDRHGHDTCIPELPDGLETRPLLDFQAGYVLRAIDRVPKQGPSFPWLTSRDYPGDVKLLRHGRVDDPNLLFASNRLRSGAGVAS